MSEAFDFYAKTPLERARWLNEGQRALEAKMAAGEQLTAPHGTEWKPLQPFSDKPPPVPPFNLKLLPAPLRDWVQDLAERKDCAPVEYAAIGAMVALGSLLGNKVGIHPKARDDWMEVANFWGCAVGPVSWLKSPTLQDAIKPLAKMETESRKQHIEAMAEHEVDVRLQKVVMDGAESAAKAAAKKGNIEEAERLIREASQADCPMPLRRRYLTNNATIEKLELLLQDNPSGILQFRDELTGWLRILDREDRGADRAWWLEAWRGIGSTSTDRITRQSVAVDNLTVSLLGGIQPAKLRPYLLAQRDGSGDDGLVERLQLLVYPDRQPFQHVDRWPDTEAKNRAFAVFQRFADIPGHDGEIPGLRFSPEGQAVFDQWYIELKTRDYPAQMQGHMDKYAGLMPALALALHLAEEHHTTPVSASAAKMAAGWCQLLEAHARRVYSLAYGDAQPARALLHRLDKLPDGFTASSFANNQWSCLKTPAERAEALQELVERGYLAAVTVETAGRPSVAYYKRPDLPTEDDVKGPEHAKWPP